jgi:hypothetical protein
VARRAAALGAPPRVIALGAVVTGRARRDPGCVAAGPISIAHASLAEIVFCLTTRLRSSPRQAGVALRAARTGADDRVLQRVARHLAIIYPRSCRRHHAYTDGLAIPTFGCSAIVRITGIEDRRPLRAPRRRVVSSWSGDDRRPGTIAEAEFLRRHAARAFVSAGDLGTHHRGKQYVINSLHVVTGASVVTTWC